jgi:hypothetical protein
MVVNLPVQAKVGVSVVQDLNVTDISATGMQVQSTDFEVIKVGLDPQSNRAEFTILLAARLACVQTTEDNVFLTGWEFGADLGEERIG